MLYSSDPSSKVLELKADEKNSVQLKLQGVDPVVSFGETQIPNFCIRDYVCASRSKNNGATWPFPHRLLKLCLKHGIADPLPPFEPSSSVRDLFCRTSVADSQVGEICLLDGEHNPARNKDYGHCSNEEDRPHDLINEDFEIGSILTNQCDIERFWTQLGAEPAAKKCSLILKQGVISETSRAEEVASTSTASDIMASKVCPVCKTFSSTSNTTLNAHMDQCLSMASDATTKNVDEIPKIVVKPAKKRLVEDIYATAPHCSLEDLDRRNGTSWATDLTMVIPPTEANAEVKKLKFSQVDDRDDRSEGAVYVDSNGIKVRILSKFNDSPQKCTKKVKLKMKNKKLSSFKLLENEAEPEIALDEESHQEGGSADQLSSHREQAHMSHGASTLQKWHCSKRSDLPKKICKKNFLMEISGEFMTRMTNPEKGNSASGDYSSAKSNCIKLSHTEKSKIVDFSANTLIFPNKSSQECSSKGITANVLRLKLSKASGSLVLSKTSRHGDSLMGRNQRSLDFRLTENCNLLPKTKKISTLSKSTSLSTKMLGKHKRKSEISSKSNEEQQRCVEAGISSVFDEEEDPSLHSGSSQCQDFKTKSSVSQTEKVGGSSIAKSVNGEVLPGLALDSDDKTRQNMPVKECGISMERIVLGKQDERTSDKSQAGATSTESSACLTSHGDLGPDTPREICCSIASTQLVPNQDSNLVINGEPSGSPVSSSSISPASLNNSLTKASDIELVSKPSAAHGHLGRAMADIERDEALDIDHNLQCKMDSTMKNPCFCSRQSIMDSTIPTSKPKMIPNLYVRPCLSSSFGAYSISHTDSIKAASLESPTGSIMARCCSVADSTSPSCGTPSQSSSNSILRLMGKNLMVTHNEESSNLPKVDSPTKGNISAVQSQPSPLSFSSYVSAPHHESFPFVVRSPVPPVTNMQARNNVRQSTVNHKAYATKEVIVFDGSSNEDMMMRATMFQGPHPYFSQQNQLLLRELGSTSSYIFNEGSSLEVPATLFPRPFVFRPPSATHLNPPLYYPQSLR